MRLHIKLYLFFAAVVIVPLLVVTAVSSLVLGRSGRETYEARMQSGLVAASALISAQQQSLASDLESTAQRIDMTPLPAAGGDARAAVLEQLRRQSNSDGIALADSRSETVASSGTLPVADASAKAGQGPMLAATIPVTADGSLKVTAYRTFDDSAVASVFSSQDVDWAFVSGGNVESGSLAAGTAFSSTSDTPLPVAGQPDGSAAPMVFDARLGDEQVLASAVAVPWSITDSALELIATVPASTAGAASAQALEAGLVLMLLTLGLAAALGFLLTRNITRPLHSLSTAVAAGIRGDLDQKVEIKSKDEIGSLSVSFNEMQDSLRAHIHDLEQSRAQMMLALSYAGDILGSTSDREALVRTTAEAARLAAGARGVWINVQESEEQPSHGSIEYGVPEDFFAGRRLAAAAELARGAREGRSAPEEMQEFVDGASALAWPLRHGQRELGSLVAVFDADYPPARSKRHILSSLVTQASSALENVNFSELQQLLAITDPMTNLSNFRYLESELRREVSKSRRYGRPLSLALIDLDDFKAVNDTYGHPAGDELLRAVARTLRDNVRGADLVARYGGEEFVVVLPETPGASAMVVAENLRAGVEALRLEMYPQITVTASIGLASFPEDADDEAALLSKADDALYRAKELGKNRSVSFTEKVG